MRDGIMAWVKLALKFLFSFAILYYMVRTDRLDLSVVSRGFSHVPLMVLSFVLILLAVGTGLVRWSLLLRGQGLVYPFSEIVRYGMIGQFFNTTMPGAVSGDLIKAWYIVSDHKGQKKTPVLASILLDRVIGVFGLILVSASPMVWAWHQVWEVPQLRHLASIVLILSVGVVFFFGYMLLADWGPLASLRRRMDSLDQYRFGRIFLQAYDSWTVYGGQPWLLIRALLLGILNHLLAVVVVILCANALGDHTLALHQYFLLAPLGLLTTAVPIAPAGLGVGHMAFAALFTLGGSSHGAEIFTMLVTIQIAINLTGVFFYLRSPKIRAAEV